MIGGAKGIGIGIDFGIPNQYCRATSKPYIEKDVLDSLRVVASAYGKSNDDADRSIVKNLVDASNPFIISNAAFKLNSGFGKYETELSDTRIWTKSKDVTSSPFSSSYNGLSGWIIFANTELTNSVDIPSIKIEVKGLLEGQELIYRYYDSTGQTNVYSMTKDGEYTLPADVRTAKTLTSNTSGFQIVKNETNTNTITITQIPSFEGAFVTDGIDDLITSTKTAQEMGITDEVTVVSMIHQIGGLNSSAVNYGYTNYFRGGNQSTLRNNATGLNKTGIYGYSATNYTPTVINNILGDKNDYTTSSAGFSQLTYGNVFSVVGYKTSDTIAETSSVAWYWTIIANKVLTTDQINQVIAYFNLDRTLKPDILCDVKKQGITNENHAEFGDKLIDFSGNGRDIQLNNLAWDGDSGIGKYNYPNWKVTATIANTYSTIVNYPTVNGTYSINVNGVSELMQSIGLHLEIKYTTSTGIIYKDIKQDGVYSYILPDGATDLTLRFGGIPGIVNEPCNITITQIPSHAGALCLDGVNDFGKVTGMPIYKDYTFIIDYERISYTSPEVWTASVASKAHTVGQGAFILMLANREVELSRQSNSFGSTTTFNRDDFTRTLLYQSKYKCGDVNLTVGEGIDGDTLWLGTLRDNDYRFFNGAIYSLMSFPYSMSEFLIERQLKKHKLGTLYPNMVEFRPIIKSNIDILKINYWDKDWNVVNVGDYISVGNDIKTNITVPNGYKVSKVTSDAFDNITIEKSSTDFIYDVKFYGIKKSPQKISITIEQDENYVLFNPVINSNYDNYKLIFHLREYEKLINIGDYIPKGTYIRANLYLKNNIDELVTFTFNGVNINYAKSPVLDTAYNIRQIYNYDSPQEVNITIDEYIRYEDIVQPYPVLLRFNDENGNEVSWGGKFRVGSTITRIGSFYEKNLIDGLYIVRNPKLNGNNLITPTHVVEKSMVFTCDTEYLLDNNEPKCILSPSRLRIPNSSYKLLGYIPDISGHGNHGVIHNSAYAEGSGVNEDGSYQFDGVDDFVTIPTVTGGKQVLMKVNWQSSIAQAMLYDQRGTAFAIWNSDKFNDNEVDTVPAYSARNGGNTYIDGILNKNILASQLRNITHNIVSTNNMVNENSVSPNIGCALSNSYYSQMSLYDFMLFDNISTDDKIKELNEYVGIEAKIELPPYYWDAYGKTNLDADKATIQQRGVAVGDYDLTNYNHAYDKMSGYGGYEFAKFDNTREWNLIRNSTGIEVVSRNGYSCTLKRVGSNVWDFGNSSNRKIGKDLNVNIKCDKNIKIKWQLKYKTTENPDTEITVELVNDSIGPNPKSITLPHKTDEELTTLGAIESSVYYLVYFDSSTLPIGEEYTVEMLPLYPNGLVYDAVTDYSKNSNIPALDDFTAIMKRKWLKKQGCPLIKGSKVYEGGNGNALLFEWDKAYNFVFYKRTDIIEGELPDNISFITPTNYNGNVITRGSEQDTNGICIAGDGNAGFANMVFYKLILYPKTIPLLQINFLKNMMEKDEIIDLNNKIFIQK